MIEKMGLFLPFIVYPHEEIREKARNIRKKYLGDLSLSEIVEKKKVFTKEYLNQLAFIPVNADDHELIKEFEKLNGVTINIFALNQETYSEDCTKVDMLCGAEHM